MKLLKRCDSGLRKNYVMVDFCSSRNPVMATKLNSKTRIYFSQLSRRIENTTKNIEFAIERVGSFNYESPVLSVN